MIFHILFTATGLFGLYQIFRVNDVFSKLILATLVTSIALFYIAFGPARPISFALFLFGGVMAIIYGLLKEGIDKEKKIHIVAIAVLVVIMYLFGLFEWPYSYFKFLLVVPIVSFIGVLIKHQKFKNEVAFLAILVSDAIFRFSLFFMDWLM